MTKNSEKKSSARSRSRPTRNCASTAGDKALLAVLAIEPLGQIELYRREFNRVLELIIRAFPSARVVIVVPTKRQARYYWLLLRTVFGDDVALITHGTHRRKRRLTVATFMHLSVLPSPPDMVLLPDAVSAVGKVAQESLSRLGDQARRVYAFVTPNSRTDTATELRLEMISGPIIWSTTPVPATVNVIATEFAIPVRADGLEGLDRKRVTCWLNPARNSFIATIAKALVNRDVPRLWSLGLLHEGPGDVLPAGDEAPYVVILVESAEHARELSRLLPGWEVVSGFKASQRSDVEVDVPDINTGTIATMTAAATMAIDADIVLSAGGDALLECAGFPLAREEQLGGRVVVVEIVDTFDAQAMQESQRRMRGYERRGWTLVKRPQNPGAKPLNRTNWNDPGSPDLVGRDEGPGTDRNAYPSNPDLAGDRDTGMAEVTLIPTSASPSYPFPILGERRPPCNTSSG